MITATIVEKKSGKEQRTMRVFNSGEKARQELKPIVHEMRVAKSKKVEPKTYIDGLSYDTKSEKMLLVEIGALNLENSTIPDDNSLTY